MKMWQDVPDTLAASVRLNTIRIGIIDVNHKG